jgi:two-component system phosphate regulon response regulator OmpR
MKQTSMSSKCYSGARGLTRALVLRGIRSAHKAIRRPALASGYTDQSPRLTLGRHPVYVEAPLKSEAGATVVAARIPGQPCVLHVDMDSAGSATLASLLATDAQVVHVATLAEARHMLANNVFSLVVLDPALPDGDAQTLVPLLSKTPLLVYSAFQPNWRVSPDAFLSKPWTSPRQLWGAVAAMLGVAGGQAAGD